MSDGNNKLPTALQQAGVNERRFSSATLDLRELAATVLRLHDLDDAEQLSAKLAGTGVKLPLQTGQSSGRDPVALCLRPNDWLIFSEQLNPKHVIERLRPCINPARTFLCDNSDGMATFRLSGPGAPWLLSKLSALDYLKGASQGQHCARTRIAHVAVVVHHHQPGGGDSPFLFDLLIDRSIAKYLWELLIASAPHADDLANEFSGR